MPKSSFPAIRKASVHRTNYTIS